MDIQQFLKASLKPREADIAVPALAAFFPDKVKPVWKVRGLTGAELGRANESSDSSQANIRTLVKALAGEGDKAEEIRKTMGISDEEVPQDIARRIEMLVAGSVEPAIGEENRDVAVRLAEAFPTAFYELTNKILGLTGQGAELGKRKGSGQTPKSS